MFEECGCTFGSKKGSTLGTEEVLRMPSLVQSSHYFLLKPREANNYWRSVCGAHIHTQKQVYVWDHVYDISDENISGGQERAG